MTNSQVFSLWNLYEYNLEQIRSVNLRNTLVIEYKNKIDNLNHDYKIKEFYLKKTKNEFEIEAIKESMHSIAHQKDKLEFETHLYFVTCLKELLILFFKSELKELAMYFFDQYKAQNEDLKIPIDIYEICLDYDEDISIDIMENSLSASTAKASYMQIALIKKYFRLAKELLRFKNCRDYLNSPLLKILIILDGFPKFKLKIEKN